MQSEARPSAPPSQSHMPDPQQLVKAFEQFGRLSDQLQQSYQQLDQRAAELTSQLALTHEQSVKQLVEQQQLARSLEEVLNTMPAGVLLIDPQGVIQTANPAAELLLEQSLLGKTWNKVYSYSVERQSEQDLLLKSGRTLHLKTQPLENHQGEIVLLDDVSEQRMLEDLAHRQNRLAAMGQMAAGLAHQLRTPLASAVLYASQLSQYESQSLQQSKAANKVRTSLRYLEKLINDMLMYAKGGEFAEQKFLLDELLVTFNTRIENRLREHAAQLTIISQLNEFQLVGSLDALVSVLMNLAENALEACQDEACKIELEVYQQSNYLILAMRDNGPGLSTEQQKKIFQPFYTQRETGTGLGLAVAQSIVQAHHGDLLVRSQPAKGATFYICLPLSRREQFMASGQQVTTDSCEDKPGKYNAGKNNRSVNDKSNLNLGE